MCGPDMRASADAYFDGAHVWDVRLISTLGFSQKEADYLKGIEGVSSVQKSHTLDALATLDDKQIALRLSSLDVESARSSVSTDSGIDSENEHYLNRPRLMSGRWPTAKDECVVAAHAPHAQAHEGSTLNLTYTKAGITSALTTTQLKVVGTIVSPIYPYTKSFGSTTLGSGSIDLYVFAPRESFAEDFPFNELYIGIRGARDEFSESDAYKTAVNNTKERIENAVDAMSGWREQDVRAHAQKKLDSKRADFETSKKDAYDKLRRARTKLLNGKRDIFAGNTRLEDAQTQIEEGKIEIAKKRTQAQEEFKGARAELAQKEQEILQQLSALGIQATTLDEAETKLDRLMSAAQMSPNPQDTHNTDHGDSPHAPTVSSVSSQEYSSLSAHISNISPSDTPASSPYVAEHTQTNQTQNRVSSSQPQSDDMDTHALVKSDDLSRLQGALHYVKQAQKARHELEEKESQALEQLAQKETELDTKLDELTEKTAQITEKQGELARGFKEYQAKKNEVDEKFKTAEAQLTDAQEKIDSTPKADIYVLDRSQHEGAAIYQADTKRMDSLARVFPVMFFLVAALVALTTMTRMIEDERTLIGTYKALGYSTSQITAKYMMYALISSGTGAVIGIVTLSSVLPYIIMRAYSVIYDIPLPSLPLSLDPVIALIAAGLGVGITLLSTWFASAHTLREAPAPLMLPRAPQAGKRILLERIRPFWHRLSFSWKVSLRNMFLYKKRLYMTVIGIAGCTALLLVGFSLHDSIWDIIDRQFGPITHYNLSVSMTDDANELDVQQAQEALMAFEEVKHTERVSAKNMSVTSHDNQKSSAATNTLVQVVVPKDASSFTHAVSLVDRITQKPLDFSEDSVILTEKAARLYNVRVGDQIVLYEHDLVGNITGEGLETTVTGICENYVGNYVYIGARAWKKITGEVPSFSTIYADVSSYETTDARGNNAPSHASKETRDTIESQLHNLPEVSMVSFSDDVIAVYRNTISVVNMVVVVLIVSAILLAFIVLYNLTNINIEERIREIASLKVLGFTKREVYSYIFRETLLIAGIGDLVGLIIGGQLAYFVIETAEVDYIMFGRIIHTESYMYALALTMIFTVLILGIMCPKLNRINMVESLKSVD